MPEAAKVPQMARVTICGCKLARMRIRSARAPSTPSTSASSSMGMSISLTKIVAHALGEQAGAPDGVPGRKQHRRMVEHGDALLGQSDIVGVVRPLQVTSDEVADRHPAFVGRL